MTDIFRPEQLLIFLDYANKYSHWQQDGKTCKQDRQSSHLVVFVLSNPKYATAARVRKIGHTCEVFTFWNSDPKQTPEPIHAALRHIISKKKAEFDARGHKLKEVLVFSDRCGEQFAGRKNKGMVERRHLKVGRVECEKHARYVYTCGMVERRHLKVGRVECEKHARYVYTCDMVERRHLKVGRVE